MSKFVSVRLVEKKNEHDIIEEIILSESDAETIVDNISGINNVILIYPHASLLALFLIFAFSRKHSSEWTYVAGTKDISEIYSALKYAYAQSRQHTLKIDLSMLTFFDKANCEKSHAYLRFNLLVD